ncbi:MAG TPA: hypothetical protein VLA99_17875, partial [Nitrospiraceae bacterium]|nr:hypothetical protein [Nitrospiraceae bacterium]
GARSSRRRIIRGASGGCQTEDNTRRQPEHNPDISTWGRRGHFYLGLTLRIESLDIPSVGT